MGQKWKQWQILITWAPKSLWTMNAATKLRRLLFGRKAMTNLDSIFKSSDITLLTKVHIVKATVFPVVMYGCDIWTIKKTECWVTDAWILWCWRRLLRASWTARRSNQSVLKEINNEHSLEGLMVKLQYFGHLMWWNRLIGKDLMLGKIEGERRTRPLRIRWWGSITYSMGTTLIQLWETLKDREAWHAAVHGVTKVWAWLSDWTTKVKKKNFFLPQ